MQINFVISIKSSTFAGHFGAKRIYYDKTRKINNNIILWQHYNQLEIMAPSSSL